MPICFENISLIQKSSQLLSREEEQKNDAEQSILGLVFAMHGFQRWGWLLQVERKWSGQREVTLNCFHTCPFAYEHVYQLDSSGPVALLKSFLVAYSESHLLHSDEGKVEFLRDPYQIGWALSIASQEHKARWGCAEFPEQENDALFGITMGCDGPIWIWWRERTGW